MTTLFKIEPIMYMDCGELVEERNVFINIEEISSVTQGQSLTGEEVYIITLNNGYEYWVTRDTIATLLGSGMSETTE